MRRGTRNKRREKDRGGGAERERTAGADLVRGGEETGAAESFSRAAMARGSSERWRKKKMCGRRKRQEPSPVAYKGGGGGEWDAIAAVWLGVA